MKKQIYYATPQELIPRMNRLELAYYYAVDSKDNEVRGTDLDKVVRLACKVLGEIVNVGKIG